jgi:hypothetical protein
MIFIEGGGDATKGARCWRCGAGSWEAIFGSAARDTRFNSTTSTSTRTGARIRSIISDYFAALITGSRAGSLRRALHDLGQFQLALRKELETL